MVCSERRITTIPVPVCGDGLDGQELLADDETYDARSTGHLYVGRAVD
jgi:hypothetical protein